MAAAIIDESKKTRTPPPLPAVGPDMARMMKVGTRVIRGPDWKWGDQVCTSFVIIICFNIGNVINYRT